MGARDEAEVINSYSQQNGHTASVGVSSDCMWNKSVNGNHRAEGSHDRAVLECRRAFVINTCILMYTSTVQHRCVHTCAQARSSDGPTMKSYNDFTAYIQLLQTVEVINGL